MLECLVERANLRNSGSNSKIYFLDSQFIEEGYRVHNITLRQKRAEQRLKLWRTASLKKSATFSVSCNLYRKG